jgi:hypothetical protein
MFQLSASSVTGEPLLATVVLLTSTIAPADLALLRPYTFDGVPDASSPASRRRPMS